MERKQADEGILDFTSLFLAFISLFPFHFMIIYIIFVLTSLYVIALQVGKIYVLDLSLSTPVITPVFQKENWSFTLERYPCINKNF